MKTKLFIATFYLTGIILLFISIKLTYIDKVFTTSWQENGKRLGISWNLNDCKELWPTIIHAASEENFDEAKQFINQYNELITQRNIVLNTSIPLLVLAITLNVFYIVKRRKLNYKNEIDAIS
jgi:hypothetical protein